MSGNTFKVKHLLCIVYFSLSRSYCYCSYLSLCLYFLESCVNFTSFGHLGAPEQAVNYTCLTHYHLLELLRVCKQLTIYTSSRHGGTLIFSLSHASDWSSTVFHIHQTPEGISDFLAAWCPIFTSYLVGQSLSLYAIWWWAGSVEWVYQSLLVENSWNAS